MNTLTIRSELVELERKIEAGLQTFVEVGLALLAIRDGRLYRDGYETFEDYCRERWGFQRRYANQLIAAAETVNILGSIDPIPTTESQARPLTRLAPDLRPIVWQEAIATAPNGKVTAAHVESVVQQFRPHVAHNSGNNEWYTPAEYIEAARATMGGIDLDPASSYKANTVVRAATIYTAEDDGLQQDWRGRVWMNPPYASDLVWRFAEKLAYHYSGGEVTEAVVLVNNATETGWFQVLIGQAGAVAFPRSRVRFWSPSGEPGAPLQGQAIIYMGANVDRFRAAFGAFGWSATL